jgi:hypothetical protein
VVLGHEALWSALGPHLVRALSAQTIYLLGPFGGNSSWSSEPFALPPAFADRSVQQSLRYVTRSCLMLTCKLTINLGREQATTRRSVGPQGLA